MDPNCTFTNTMRKLSALILGLLIVGCAKTPKPAEGEKDPPAASRWISQLESEDAAVRLEAVRVLGEMTTADQAVITALTKTLLSESDEGVYTEAFAALS